MRTLLNIARKDALVLLRDKAAVLVLIAMPLGLIFILGSALGNLETGDFRVKVGIVNEDAGEVGRQFVQGLTDNEDLKKVFEMTVSDEAAAIRADVEEGDLNAALIIPADLSSTIALRKPAAVELLQDPGSPIAAGAWAGVVRAGVAYASAELVIGRTIEAEMTAGELGWQLLPPAQRGTGGASAMPDVELTAVTMKQTAADVEKTIPMMSYYAVAMSAMFILFGSMFGAFAFVKERRDQTLARMMVAPVAKTAIVGGKGLGIVFVGLAQLAVLIVGTMLMFRVDWGEHVEAAVLLGAAEVFAATGMAMTLAALGKTERTIGAIGPAMIMIFAATGGSMFPASAMPAWIKPAQVVSPSYWTLEGFLAVIKGATVSDVAGKAGIVVVIGLVLYAFGVWRLRYE